MKLYLYLILPVIMFLIISGCKSETATEPDVITGEGDLTINGVVIDNTSGETLGNADVVIVEGGNQINRVTDATGKFSAAITVDKSELVSIFTYLKGYYSDTTSLNVIGGKDTSVSIKLQEKTVNTDVSGDPASIVLINTSAQSIGVKESGSVESAIVTFEVQDSSGVPVDIDHSALVNFSIGQGPGGGEFINPASVKTNANGRVVVSISSGTKAGVIQFIAQINSNGTTILSKPVNIAIHGGHPDQNHLSVFPKYLNVAGWHINGNEDLITAIVGDKYANPVKPLTAVYFTTTGGIIEGSALTNNDGEGTVKLITGNPLTADGFVTVYVSTADENSNKITDSTIVLFSGKPILTAPSSFTDISHGGEAVVQYTIKDVNGNPIAAGNYVSVTIAEGQGVQLLGDVDFTTIDTQSKDFTSYSFKIIDDDIDKPLGTRSIVINIKVSGPNGSAAANVSGIVD
jgi:hypothetical protein